jgi:hypothetical protein
LTPDRPAAVDRNFVATFPTLGDGVEGALVRTIGRVPVAATMLPLTFFNAAFVAEPPPDGARDLEAAVTLLRELGVPFTVHFRSDLDSATRTAADGLGLAWTGTLPGMAMPPGSRTAGSPPDRRPRGVRVGPTGRMLGSLEETDR